MNRGVKEQKSPTRGVTERNTSLHSGSIDSVQNSEAELQNFEAVARAEALEFKWGSAPNPANFEKFDQTSPLFN